MTVILNSLREISLLTAWQAGFEGQPIAFSDQASTRIADSRAAFERLLNSETPPYMYGSTAAPGARAKTMLSTDNQEELVRTQNLWAAREIGMGRKMVPDHGVRLVRLARLASYIEGNVAVSLPTAEWVAGLTHFPPGAMPLEAATGPGEVMPLSCIYPNEFTITLKAGENMALYNGSPCATGLALDAALTARRWLNMIHCIMALSVEAVGAPLEAYDPAFGAVSVDPHLKSALDTLNTLLADVPRDDRMTHQAPVSWRILPTMLAAGAHAVSHAEETALNAIRSVAQNPLFVPPDADHPNGRVLSTGGYHNQQASRAIDGLNAAAADMCVLAAKHTARLLDGAAFGLPKMLVAEGSGVVGTEFLAWMHTGLADRARLAATPATLPTGLEDPCGAQSDIASPIFLAYERHLDVSDDLMASLAVLCVSLVQTYRLTSRQPPQSLQALHDEIARHVIPFDKENFVQLGTSIRTMKSLLADATIGQGALSELVSVELN